MPALDMIAALETKIGGLIEPLGTRDALIAELERLLEEARRSASASRPRCPRASPRRSRPGRAARRARATATTATRMTLAEPDRTVDAPRPRSARTAAAHRDRQDHRAVPDRAARAPPGRHPVQRARPSLPLVRQTRPGPPPRADLRRTGGGRRPARPSGHGPGPHGCTTAEPELGDVSAAQSSKYGRNRTSRSTCGRPASSRTGSSRTRSLRPGRQSTRQNRWCTSGNDEHQRTGKGAGQSGFGPHRGRSARWPEISLPTAQVKGSQPPHCGPWTGAAPRP